MKKVELENMSLEELLEFENNHKVLSYEEFHYTKNYRKIMLIDLIYPAGKKLIDINKLLTEDYNKYRKSLTIYQVINMLYDKILEDLILEIKNSSIEKEPLSLSILLAEYLIPHGLVSYTHSFHETNSQNLFSGDGNYNYECYAQGMYVLAGYGCCRHVTSFISNIFHKMKIPNDVITCMEATKEEIFFHMLEHLTATHAILGYEMDGKYYLSDIFNRIYNLSIKKKYIENNHLFKLVLDYTQTNLLQPNLYWNPNLEYATVTEKELKEKRNKVAISFQKKEWDRFQKFKENHYDMIQKIAYLTPIEFERTEEKENQKRKRI